MAKNTEIERKFLVRSDAFKAQAVTSYEIVQGYLCKDPEKTIRVRIRDARAFLTIKSSVLREGLAKFEWERELDLEDAKELMTICPDIKVPEHIQTAAGLLLNSLEILPQPGQSVRYGSYLLTAVSTEFARIREVRITRLPAGISGKALNLIKKQEAL